MRQLPLIPYEVCEWSYGHRVGADSHIWFLRCQYSVPYRYIGETVDVKFNASLIFVYHKHTEIARHERFGKSVQNAKRTIEAHLPIPLKQEETIESLLSKGKEIGLNTLEVIKRMFEDAKVKAQPALDVMSLFSISRDYSSEELERACHKALGEFTVPTYADVRKCLNKKVKITKDSVKKEASGLLRGADYYKGGAGV